MKSPPRTNKILITIPFWSRDRDQAMELARLLADLEQAHSEIADFAFACFRKIPMIGAVGSLNASVSAAILLYEVARQRRSV